MRSLTVGRRNSFLGLALAGAAGVAAPMLGEPLAAAATGVDYAGLKRALGAHSAARRRRVRSSGQTFQCRPRRP